jgi:hypothetical protein
MCDRKGSECREESRYDPKEEAVEEEEEEEEEGEDSRHENSAPSKSGVSAAAEHGTVAFCKSVCGLWSCCTFGPPYLVRAASMRMASILGSFRGSQTAA